MATKITTEKLLDAYACAFHVRLFRRVFRGHLRGGVEVTAENIAKADAAGADVGWLRNLIPIDSPARSKFDETVNSAWVKYDDAVVASWREYDANTLTWDEQQAISAAAWKEYRDARNAALVEAFS